ncbi:3D domain-containing protein [Paenisporosarcina quisquiliarum]|uniref:3D domain-containing protein n=1 Tax=Paenisporosarcina quisquiliarum TaxID=365346 RepID=UPI0037354677
MKKFSFVLSFVLMFLVAFANDSEAASSVHTVKKGDTLYKIARQYNISVASIKSANNLKSNLIKPNQKLKVTKKVVAKAKAKAKPKAKAAKKAPSRSDNDTILKEITVSASAYTAGCNGCSGITSTGINLKKNPGLKVIAVDPRVIPLGSKVYVEGYGYAIAGDTGGAIKGNKIDVFIPTKSGALNWGRKTVKIKVFK